MQKKISFLNSKGQRLVGVLHIPSPRSTSSRVEAGKGKGPFPTVIVQHGFRGSHESRLVVKISQALEKAGFIALRFSLPGHKPSGGTYKDILVSQYINDEERAIKFLLKQPQVNKTRIGIVGHSMGAFIALITGNKLSKYLNVVVSLSSVYDNQAVIKTYVRDKKIGEIGKDYWVVSGFKVTNKYFKDRMFLQKQFLIKDIHGPTLVIHGDQDKRVQVKDGYTIYKLLECPKELKIIKGADHNFKEDKDAAQVVKLTVGWFKKYLAFKEARVVNAILECNGKILLVKRGNKVASHRGMWSPIGGYMEDGLSVLDQAKKEVKEELGINSALLKNYKLGKNFVIDEKKIDRKWRVYPILFRLKKLPKIKLDWENIAYRWVKPEEIKKIKTVEFRIYELLGQFGLLNSNNKLTKKS
ncbi:MAG: prolyl oligopeptidase family serine peptidase [Candidatus Komeilibacteria bacterium]|nr:prolyl oligopeptidase family serine peptidase [Candidatus Komeilibacteria bacterium]